MKKTKKKIYITEREEDAFLLTLVEQRLAKHPTYFSHAEAWKRNYQKVSN